MIARGKGDKRLHKIVNKRVDGQNLILNTTKEVAAKVGQ